MENIGLSFSVDYGKPFADLIKAAGFNWFNPDIVDMCFDIVSDDNQNRGAVMDGKIFDYNIFSLEKVEHIKGIMADNGYRLGTPREMISFYSQNSIHLQSAQFVAINPSFEKSLTENYVLGIDTYDNEACLCIYNICDNLDRHIFGVKNL
ncbi:MAG: hypothetical protein WCK37_05200 [Candidatus Falkowbacteria bacterium]